MVQDKGKLVHATPANELTEKLFGFESVINKTKSTDAAATTFTISSDAVPSGKIWKITHVALANADGDVTTVILFVVVHDDIDISFYRKAGATGQSVVVDKNIELYLDVDDYIKAVGYTVAVGETIVLNIFGYEMNAP